MNCRVTDLCEKEIINLKDGCRLGCVSDVEIDTCSGRLVSVTVGSKNGFFGFGRKCDEIKIAWEQIQVIGDDTVLVNIDAPCPCVQRQKKNPLGGLFREG